MAAARIIQSSNYDLSFSNNCAGGLILVILTDLNNFLNFNSSDIVIIVGP